MNLRGDVSHLVSMIMPAVFDQEMWMKFQSGKALGGWVKKTCSLWMSEK